MCGKKDTNRMARGQVGKEGVVKRRTVALQVPLGQGQSDVQGCFPVATENSSYAKAQDAYDDLNRVTTKNLLVAGSDYNYTFWDEFHVNNSI